MKWSLFPPWGVFALPSRILGIPVLPAPLAPLAPWQNLHLQSSPWLFWCHHHHLYLHFVAPTTSQENSFKVQFMLCRIAKLGGKKNHSGNGEISGLLTNIKLLIKNDDKFILCWPRSPLNRHRVLFHFANSPRSFRGQVCVLSCFLCLFIS